MTAPRPADTQSDVWVVNGRVIRFLDPMRPEDTATVVRRPGRLRGLLGALRTHGAQHR